MLHNPESISALLTIAQTSLKFTCTDIVIYVLIILICSNPASLFGRPTNQESALTSFILNLRRVQVTMATWKFPRACPDRSLTQQREILYCPRGKLIGRSKPVGLQGYFLHCSSKPSIPLPPPLLTKRRCIALTKLFWF